MSSNPEFNSNEPAPEATDPLSDFLSTDQIADIEAAGERYRDGVQHPEDSWFAEDVNRPWEHATTDSHQVGESGEAGESTAHQSFRGYLVPLAVGTSDLLVDAPFGWDVAVDYPYGTNSPETEL